MTSAGPRGFTLVEVMVALAITAIALVAGLKATAAQTDNADRQAAVLLAGVYARGTTTLNEPSPSRNHTELMLPEFGVTTTAADRTASVTGPAALRACEVQVPGDPSSAAFLVCAAVLKPDSSIQVENVSLNTARIGFTRTLERMGADVSVRHAGAAGKEPYGVIGSIVAMPLIRRRRPLP